MAPNLSKLPELARHTNYNQKELETNFNCPILRSTPLGKNFRKIEIATFPLWCTFSWNAPHTQCMVTVKNFICNVDI